MFFSSDYPCAEKKENSNPTSVAAFKSFCPEATVLAKKYVKKNQQRVKNFKKTITSLALFGCEVIQRNAAPGLPGWGLGEALITL